MPCRKPVLLKVARPEALKGVVFPCPVNPEWITVGSPTGLSRTRVIEGRTMSFVTLTCPKCSVELKAPPGLPVGRKVLCRGCGTTFAVQAATAEKARSASRGMGRLLLVGGILGGV